MISPPPRMSFCSYICLRLSSTPLLFSFLCLCSEFWWFLPLDLPAHECSSQYYHTIFKFSITLLSNSKLKLLKLSQNLGLVFVILVSEVWCFLWQLVCTRSLVLTKTQTFCWAPFQVQKILQWTKESVPALLELAPVKELFFAFLPWLLISSGTFFLVYPWPCTPWAVGQTFL